MKKLIVFVLIACLLLPVLASCGGSGSGGSGGAGDLTDLPDWMSGKDAAMLLLANERLNAALLKNDGNIFEDGAEVLYNLATLTIESLALHTYAAGGSAGNKTTYGDGSSVEINGDVYTFRNFAEYSNSGSYFDNLTNGVASTAEAGAQLIDDVKKYVRVLDTWVDREGMELYLHVEDNCEVLYSRLADQYEICKRTKNGQGVNTYEIYIANDIAETRMLYIPGQLCEYSHRSKTTDFDHNFLAENTKGYWEVVDVGRMPTHYNVSCMVLKNDICYDAFYDPAYTEEWGKIMLLKVISADRKTDILNYSRSEDGSEVTLALQAFTGYSHLTFHGDAVHSEWDPTAEQNWYHASENGTLVLHNGMTLCEGDTFLDGQIEISLFRVDHFFKEENSDGSVPEMVLHISSNEVEESMRLLNEFLALVGLSCTRDMEYVKNGILQAYAELDQFVKYHKWGDSLITTNETLTQGYENNKAKFGIYSSMYEAIKNGEVIDFSDRELIELRIRFAPITAITATARNTDMRVSVSDISLTVSDTLLYVEDEPYVVNYALVGIGAATGLTHIATENAATTVYTGGDSFTVSGSAVLDLPILAAGAYTLVAYISTADGIRASEYVTIPFETVTPVATTQGNIAATVARADTGALLLSCAYVTEAIVEIALPESGTHSYDTMYTALAAQAYAYGFTAENVVVEMLDGETWTPLAGSEEALPAGQYRLQYRIQNGESLIEGYVITTYAPAVVE